MGGGLGAKPLYNFERKMGKNLILLSFFNFVFFITTTFAQNISLYGNVGYNFPMANKFIYSYTDNSSEFIKSNYGEGLSTKLGATYFIFENFGLDLGFSYLFSLDKFSNGNIGEVNEYFKNTNLSISPSIVIQSNFGKLIPYAKFGFSINFIKVNLFLNDLDYPSYEYSTDYTFGLNANVGLKYPIDNQIIIFTELSLSSLTLFADKVIYNWEENGIKKSEEFELGTKFVGTGIANLEAARDYPFSSLGISLGIMFNL